jgi:hypothetical protein
VFTVHALLQLRYGAEPYRYKIKLQFPSSHPEGASTGELLIELASAKFMPHAVYLVRQVTPFRRRCFRKYIPRAEAWFR